MIADRPVFIGGMMRSGTTLLRAMLGRHSALAAGLETFWFAVDPHAGTARGAEPLADYADRLAGYLELPAGRVREIAGNAESAADFLDRIMAELAAAAGKPRWVEKTPANVLHVDAVFEAWPDARFIVMTRDPRAVFASFYGTDKEMSPQSFAERWGAHIRAGDFARDRYGPARIAEVVYEDLVRAPEATMRRVSDFVAVPFEPETARFSGQSQDYDKVRHLADHESSTLRQLAQPLDPGRADAWRARLTAELADAVRDAAYAEGLGARFDALAGLAETLGETRP